MVTIIIGRKGSGKSHLVKEAQLMAEYRKTPIPIVIEANDSFLKDPPVKNTILQIEAAGMIGASIIITVQLPDNKCQGIPTIPYWLSRYSPKIISMERLGRLFENPIPGTDNNV